MSGERDNISGSQDDVREKEKELGYGESYLPQSCQSGRYLYLVQYINVCYTGNCYPIRPVDRKNISCYDR